MEKPPFQFSLRGLLLLVTALSVWIGTAEIIGGDDTLPLLLRLVVMAGVAVAIYLVAWRHPLGWAIAVFGTPIVVLAALSLLFIFAD